MSVLCFARIIGQIVFSPQSKKEITDSEWWRVLSLKVTGFSYGLVRMRSSFDTLSSATNPIDLDIMLRKPTIKGRALSVRGIMSCFDVVLVLTCFDVILVSICFSVILVLTLLKIGLACCLF